MPSNGIARYDGLHGVWTSLDRKRYAAQDIYAYYGQLWRIEDGFRVLKHTMMTRPIYHWDPPPRTGAHGDLLRRLCVVTPVALPIQLHACRPGAAQRSAHPGRAHPTFKPPSLVDTSTLKRYLVAFPLPPATKVQRALYRVVDLTYPSRTRELIAADPLP